jgi:hypothetical protein
MSTPYKKYQKEINKHWKKLQAVQETCTHPIEFIEQQSADGDIVKFKKCNYCGKVWLENY